MHDDLLTLHGNKRAEREEKDEGAAPAASCAASACRLPPAACRLPPDADASRAHASFTRGVLTVTVPKTTEAHARVKKIDVKSF